MSFKPSKLFPQQQRVLNQLPEIQGLLEKYQRSQDGLTLAENSTRHFIVRVPLIGKFSSGKSTILNALIGENIFATNVDPETAVPAELSYSAEEAFIACYSDGKRVEVSRDEIKNNQFGIRHRKIDINGRFQNIKNFAMRKSALKTLIEKIDQIEKRGDFMNQMEIRRLASTLLDMEYEQHFDSFLAGFRYSCEGFNGETFEGKADSVVARNIVEDYEKIYFHE